MGMEAGAGLPMRTPRRLRMAHDTLFFTQGKLFTVTNALRIGLNFCLLCCCWCQRGPEIVVATHPPCTCTSRSVFRLLQPYAASVLAAETVASEYVAARRPRALPAHLHPRDWRRRCVGPLTEARRRGEAAQLECACRLLRLTPRLGLGHLAMQGSSRHGW